MNNPLFVTFNYESWPLATHLELLQKSVVAGEDPTWLDLTGIIRKHFEFPFSNRLHIKLVSRKLKRLSLYSLKLESSAGTFKESNQDINIQSRANSVAHQELISLTRNSKPCLIHNKRLYNKLKDLYLRNYSHAYIKLNSLKPSVVILFNGRFVEERAFWNAADDLGFPVIFYETFAQNWDDRYFVFKEPTHSPEYRGLVMEEFGQALLSSDPAKFKKVAIDFFESRVSATTNKFIKHQENKTEYHADLPIVSFFHSSQDELVMVNLIDQFWTSQEMALAQIVNLLDRLGGHRLVIRIHPHLLHKAKQEYSRWELLGKSLAAKYDWIRFIPAEDSANTYDLVRASKIVVTCASTVGVEASYLRKPSILLGRAFHETMGITCLANSLEELESLLLSDYPEEFLDKARIQAMKYGVFLELGGEKFEYISTVRNPRLKYEIENVTISKSSLVRIIQYFEIRLKKVLQSLKYSVVCNHDCGVDSSKGWK